LHPQFCVVTALDDERLALSLAYFSIRAIFAAAEDAAVVGGAREVYLHLRDRDGDGPGGRLYARAGYRASGRDPALLALVLAQDRRSLMRKRLW
jgi:hypothetical protein